MPDLIKKQPHAIKLSAWRITHLICAVGISFMIMPFLIHHLGKHYYGIWILVSVFSAYYGMVDLGLSTAIQRYIAQAIGKKDINSINEIVATALISYSFLAILVLIFGGMGYMLIPYIFHWELSDIDLLQNCFLVMLGGLAVSFPLRSFTGMLGAALRQDISAKTDILYVAAKAVGTVFVVLRGDTLLSIAVVSVIVDLVYYLLIIYLVKKVYLSLRISLNYVSFVMAKKLFRYAFYSFINKLSEILKLRIDTLVISVFMVVSDVTIYSVAFRLFDYFNEIIISIVGFSDAYLSRYDGSGEKDRMSVVFSNFTRITSIISVFIGLSLILYGKYFISRWVGDDFNRSCTVLPYLVIPGILAASQDPLRRLFYATSKHHLLAYISLFEGVCNVTLSLILVKSYGLIGVALGTAIPSLFISLFLVPLYGCSIIQLSLRKYWLKLVLLPASVTATFVIGYFSFIKGYLAADFGRIITLSVCQIVVFIPFCFFVFLKKNERYIMINYLKSRFVRE